MTRDISAGPAAGAAWLPYTSAGTGTGTGPRPFGTPILAVPDGANPQRAAAGEPDRYHGLPVAPQVALDAAGQPVLSLSLLLARRPGPDDDDIFGLVDSAALACDLTLALPDGASDDALRPLFARDVQLRLLADHSDGLPLAEAQGWGAGARIALGTRLNRAGAQAVLQALNGQPCGLSLHCTIRYRSSGERRDVRMLIHWAAVHDLLAPQLEDDGGLNDSALRALLPALLEAGAIEAWLLEAGHAPVPLAPAQADSLWRPFMMFSSMLLEAVTPPGIIARFRLRERPDDGARLDTRVSLDTARDETTTLHAPLEDVLGKVLDGLDAERFIHLTCIDLDAPGGTAPVPRRMRSAPRTRGTGATLAGTGAGLAMVGADAVSLSRALEPDSRKRAPASALLASDAVKLHPGPAHAFATHAMVFQRIEETDEPVAPLPRVDDPNAPLWNDQADAGHAWYAPEYTLVAPDPAGAPDAASFLFRFHESGHDASGRLTLEGSVRFRLRRGISAATEAAIKARAGVRADPVATTSLTASLSLPMRDNDGHLRRVDLPAQLTDAGDTVEVEVALLNDYVRVAYGDLAFAGFQPEPARLQLACSFEAMVLVSHFPAQFPLSLQTAGKLQVTPIAFTAAQQKLLAGKPHLDALQMTYRGLAADMQFRREAPASRGLAAEGDNVGGESAEENGDIRDFAVAADEAAARDADPAEDAEGNGDTVQRTRPAVLAATGMPAIRPALAAGTLVNAQLAPAIRPELEQSGRLQALIARRRYARQTQGRSVSLDLLFPCATHAALYRQERDGGSAAVGCQDSFSLGQAPIKLYEAVNDPGLSSAKYKLYRSATQPGRFLVVPTAYLITRYAPTEGERAWRPANYLYSTIDPVTAANNRCVLMAALQPDLSPLERQQLESKLANPVHPATIEYITALDSEVQYTWALAAGAGAMQVEASRLYDSFQVTLATDRTGALLLQSMLTHSGVAGQARFKLADGSLFTSNLRLDLNHLTGPWDVGPVEIARSDKQATLTNRIERPVDVAQLLVAGADGGTAWVACDRSLKSGEAVTLDLPFEARQAWAAYTVPPGDPATLNAINSFIENIDVNVVFVILFDFANHNLVSLSLVVRIKEAPGSDTPVTFGPDRPVGEAKFVLPLTVYLGPRTLQFQVTKTDNAGTVTSTAWLESDLAAGSFVSLAWDLIK